MYDFDNDGFCNDHDNAYDAFDNFDDFENHLTHLASHFWHFLSAEQKLGFIIRGCTNILSNA